MVIPDERLVGIIDIIELDTGEFRAGELRLDLLFRPIRERSGLKDR
jgi:hypothetical protein